MDCNIGSTAKGHCIAQADRQTHSTANPFETQFGYSRAVRRGPFIFVSGTTSLDPFPCEVLHPTSAYGQAVQAFCEIFKAVTALGGRKQDVVRVRMFVSADEDAAAVGRALKEGLADVAPAATMIIGARFVLPEMKVEIEADAVVFE